LSPFTVLNQHLAGMSADAFATLKTLLQKMLSNGQALQVQSGPLPSGDSEAPP
jgi:hypothetical protein